MKPPKYPPGHKADMYSMTYKCCNCKQKIDVYLKRGTLAPDKAKETCPNCGCKTVWKI